MFGEVEVNVTLTACSVTASWLGSADCLEQAAGC